MLSRFRRPRLENLERRHLLTLIAPDLWYWPAGDQFTVRRDEAEPIELNVFFPFSDGIRPAVDVASPDGWGGESSLIEAAQSQHGLVKVAPRGQSILYQPDPGFVGIDLVTLTLAQDDVNADGQTAAGVEADELTKTIAVNVVEPLLAVDDWFAVDVGGQLKILDVLSNDIRNARYIGQEPILTLQEFRSDSGGEIAIDDDQTHLIYTPAAGFEGIETIVYTAIDQDGYTLEGTAQVRVDGQQRDALWPEQLQQQLVQQAVQRHQYSFGVAEFDQHERRIHFDFLDLAPGADPTVAIAEFDNAAENVSGTNNQIAEVDESDRVKTDGEFLYVLSSPDHDNWREWDFFPWFGLPRGFAPIPEPDGENLLTVVDVRQPDAPRIVSRQLFQDRVLSLDLEGDRLTVLSQRERQTVVTTLDVSDPQAIQTVWTTVVDGQFKQARRAGESLYVFTDQFGVQFPDLETKCDDTDEFCFFETGDQYLQRVRDSLVEFVFPSQQVFDAAGNPDTDVPSMLVDPLDVGIPDYQGRLNIITFDTSSEIGGASDWDISQSGQHVLVTPTSIYVTRTDHRSSHSFEDELPILIDVPERPLISTAIERFAITDDGTVDLSASGAVPGVLNNSFSLDEHDGLLRIATENSWWSVSDDDDGTNVYVLQQSDEAFELLGGATNLAPGEQVYAVRFAGDRGYVVTFRRVDPLFVIDLSEPTAPQILGQLKTPGYSQYLHIISEDHLFGVGRDADEENGLYDGLIVSLFNVSDPSEPVVQDRYEFAGGRSTFSPFAEDSPWDLRDHHAISYFPESGILALPIYSKIHPWNIEDSDPIFDSPEQSAVRTLRIDTDTGIEELDSIEFDSRADRTVRIGEHLYSLSNQELKVTHLLQPDGVVASLVFERNGTDDFVDTEVGSPVTIDVTDNDGVGEDVQILGATLLDGEGQVDVVDGKRIRFTPTSRSLVNHRIRYTARDAAGTLIDAFATVDPDIDWQNHELTLDVNRDGKRSALDALNVINWLQRYGGGDSEEIERQIGNADAVQLFYFDTTGDGMLSARDALLIINDMIEEVLLATGDDIDNSIDQIIASSFSDPGIQGEGEKLASFDSPGLTAHEAIDVVIAERAGSEDDSSSELLPL